MGAPSNLMVTTFPGVLQVDLKWTDGVFNETGFFIERSTNGMPFEKIAQVPAGTTEYSDTTVSKDMLLKYRVYAAGSTSQSAYSNEISWISEGNNPSNLEGQIYALEQEIFLQWQGNNSHCTYRIQKTTGTYTTKTTIDTINLPAGSSQYRDKNITPGNVYTYFVMAVSSSGASSGSNQVTFHYLQPPSNVKVQYFPGTKVLGIKWQDNSSSESKFVVEKAHSNKGGIFSYEAPANATEYEDYVTFDKLHMYRVKAVGPNGESSPYSEVCYWYAPPNLPNNVKATALTSCEVKLTWLDMSEIETSYKIWRKSGNTIITLDAPANSTEYIDKGLTPSTNYSYSMVAINSQSNTQSDIYPPVTVVTPQGVIISDIAAQLKINTTLLPGTQMDTVLQIGSPRMTVNGESREIDPGNNTVPLIVEGSTMLPIRAIVEAYGGTVAWDGTTRKITVNCNGQTLELWIGKADAKVNGATKTSTVAPMIINGRTMLPLRFVSENLGLNVEWDGIKKQVTIKVPS